MPVVMKKIISSGLIIFLILVSCAQQKKPPHIGAWQLVSWKHFYGDTIDWQFPGDYTGSNIVIFSERHILSVGLFKKDTTVKNNYVGASYALDGNRFEETLLYSPNPEMVGHTVKQIFEVRNDTLMKFYPCDDNWELIKSDYFIEKYINLE
jgi:hypothetical protein